MNIYTDNDFQTHNINPKYFSRELNEIYDFAEDVLEGGMGQIFPCRLKGTKAFNLVLKIYKKARKQADNEKIKDLFREEILLNLKMNIHPNVVTILNGYKENENYFMVMELIGKPLSKATDKIPQTDLASYLNKRNKEKADIETLKKQYLLWLIQACDGLEYIHKILIKNNKLPAHRDIKPNNFLIGPDKKLKIIDFGLAVSNKTYGTKEYAAPELLKGALPGVSSDIYALGLILYQLFNDNKNPNIVIQTDNKIESSQPQKINKKSLFYDNIFKKCCAENPKKRYASLQDLRADLEKAYGAKVPQEKEYISAVICAIKAEGFFNLEDYENAVKYIDKAKKLDFEIITWPQYLLRLLANYNLNRQINLKDVYKILEDQNAPDKVKGLARYLEAHYLLTQLSPKDRKEFEELSDASVEECALDSFNKALELGYDDGDVYFGCASCYFNLKKWKETIKYCTLAEKHKCNHTQIFYMRAISNSIMIQGIFNYYESIIKQKMPAEIKTKIKDIAANIEKDFSIVIAKEYNKYEVYLYLAFAQDILGKKEQCKDSLKWAFNFLKNLSSKEQNKAKEAFELGKFCLKKNYKDLGIEFFKLAKESDPKLMGTIELLCYDQDKDDWVDEIDPQKAS